MSARRIKPVRVRILTNESQNLTVSWNWGREGTMRSKSVVAARYDLRSVAFHFLRSHTAASMYASNPMHTDL